jgi:hypothetical protein
MSFPHRTAFYDSEEDEIKLPDDLIHSNFEIKTTPKGINFAKQWLDTGYSDVSERFLLLASTGLQDSHGNEIFEGHIFGGNAYSNSVVIWSYKQPKFVSVGDRYDYPLKDGEHEIIGHALTDPDLVPDNFDVEEYFGIDEHNGN